MSATSEAELSKKALQSLKSSFPSDVDLQQVKQIKADANRKRKQYDAKKESVIRSGVSRSQYALELLSQSCTMSSFEQAKI